MEQNETALNNATGSIFDAIAIVETTSRMMELGGIDFSNNDELQLTHRDLQNIHHNLCTVLSVLQTAQGQLDTLTLPKLKAVV